MMPALRDAQKMRRARRTVVQRSARRCRMKSAIPAATATTPSPITKSLFDRGEVDRDDGGADENRRHDAAEGRPSRCLLT